MIFSVFYHKSGFLRFFQRMFKGIKEYLYIQILIGVFNAFSKDQMYLPKSKNL